MHDGKNLPNPIKFGKNHVFRILYIYIGIDIDTLKPIQRFSSVQFTRMRIIDGHESWWVGRNYRNQGMVSLFCPYSLCEFHLAIAYARNEFVDMVVCCVY